MTDTQILQRMFNMDENPHTKIVYAALCALIMDDAYKRMSIVFKKVSITHADISRKTGVSVRTISTAITTLEAKSLIVVDRSKRGLGCLVKPNEYSFPDNAQ